MSVSTLSAMRSKVSTLMRRSWYLGLQVGPVIFLLTPLKLQATWGSSHLFQTYSPCYPQKVEKSFVLLRGKFYSSPAPLRNQSVETSRCLYVTGESSETWGLRWCEMDFVHPQRGVQLGEMWGIRPLWEGPHTQFFRRI